MNPSFLGTRLFFVSLVVLFLLLGVGGNRWLLAAETTPADEVAAPRLVVVLVIDQLRADYLVRFRDRFGPDGFNRLLRQGANFVSCFYPYARTVTGAGHATLATGTTPDRHGIAGNEWYDPDRGEPVEAVIDEAFPLVGVESQRGASPHNLVGNTLADELRLATGSKAKVFGVALKDRSAIFSTGHTASGAYWYDYQSGRFVTSRYYRKELPAWVTAFNNEHGSDSYYGKEWKADDRVLLSLTSQSGQPDAQFYRRLVATPYGNEIVLNFAQELVRRQGLGEDDVTDFLFIGFSSNDIGGHRWGPYSDEVQELTVQTDAQVAELLGFLDRQVGAGNYWLAISADHGVAPPVEQARAHGIRAKTFDGAAVQAAVKKALVDRWGEAEWLVPRAGLTFNRETLREHNVSLAQAAKVVGQAAMAFDAIIGYVGPHVASADAATIEFVRRSSYPGRSADVVLIQAPFASSEAWLKTAMHGTHYSYDTHVPLIFFGAAFRPGTYRRQVSTTDLAPTLAAALGITPPALATGKVLAQALGSAKASSAAGEERE